MLCSERITYSWPSFWNQKLQTKLFSASIFWLLACVISKHYIAISFKFNQLINKSVELKTLSVVATTVNVNWNQIIIIIIKNQKNYFVRLSRYLSDRLSLFHASHQRNTDRGIPIKRDHASFRFWSSVHQRQHCLCTHPGTSLVRGRVNVLAMNRLDAWNKTEYLIPV